jgi:cytochrome c biogenesis protein CcmG/thiol:disulfide interchange protein DsbE
VVILKKPFYRISIIYISLTLFLLLTGCSKAVILRIGQAAPAFALKDISGKTIRVPEDVKGRVVAIRFWASWCKSCAAEMPELEQVYRNYSGKGLLILAVNIGQDEGDVEKFSKEHNISYPLLPDPGQKVTKRYGVTSIPITFILDGRGIIRQKILGEISRQNFEEILVKWMKEKKS